MARLSLRHWLNRMAPSSRSGRRCADLPHRRRSRPHLEALEGRCLPSTVSNLNDAGAGSFRQAIIDTPTGGTVDFQAGLSGTISLSTGELLIAKDLTIAGPGADVITVSGHQGSRVFEITAGVTVALAGLTVADGFPGTGQNGGGIFNHGRLTVTDSTVSGNHSDYAGGGIYNIAGTLTVTRSTLSGNTAGTSGGGIFNYAGTATVTASTLSGNSARYGGGIDNAGTGTVTVTASTLSGNSAGDDGDGGGILNDPTAKVTVTASTLSGNSARYGGGIYNARTLTVTSSTLSGNTATAGGGIYNTGTQGAANSRNTLVAGNAAASAPDMSGPLTSQGHNLIGDGTGSSGFSDTDLVGTADMPIDPLLGPLQDNGGPTQTMALLPGSPAIDAGDTTGATRWDQRGRGYHRIVNGVIDIGAFEVQPGPDSASFGHAPADAAVPNIGLSVELAAASRPPVPVVPGSRLPDRQAPQQSPDGQPARSEAASAPVPLATARHAQDAVFEAWDMVPDGLALNWT